MTDTKHYMQTVGQQARAASAILAKADTAPQNSAIIGYIYDALQQAKSQVLAANATDMQNGQQRDWMTPYLTDWRSPMRVLKPCYKG